VRPVHECYDNSSTGTPFDASYAPAACLDKAAAVALSAACAAHSTAACIHYTASVSAPSRLQAFTRAHCRTQSIQCPANKDGCYCSCCSGYCCRLAKATAYFKVLLPACTTQLPRCTISSSSKLFYTHQHTQGRKQNSLTQMPPASASAEISQQQSSTMASNSDAVLLSCKGPAQTSCLCNA
jgi:hypothetical protein